MRNILCIVFGIFALNAHSTNVIVPFSAGGPTDRIARVLVESLNQQQNEKYLVENLPGGGGQIAFHKAVESTSPYLIFSTSTVIINSQLPQKFLPAPNKYTIEDFVPVNILGEVPLVLVTNLKGLEDINNSAFFAHGGLGSTAHISAAFFNTNYNFSFNFIPYKGSSDSLPAMIRNEVNYEFHFLADARKYHGYKNIKAIAITGTKRDKNMMDVPTFAELGMKSMNNVTAGFYLVSNKRFSQEAVQKLNNRITALKKENIWFINALEQEGIVINHDVTPNRTFDSHARNWKQIIQESKL